MKLIGAGIYHILHRIISKYLNWPESCHGKLDEKNVQAKVTWMKVAGSVETLRKFVIDIRICKIKVGTVSTWNSNSTRGLGTLKNKYKLMTHLSFLQDLLGIACSNPAKSPSRHYPSLWEWSYAQHWGDVPKDAHWDELGVPENQIAIHFVRND